MGAINKIDLGRRSAHKALLVVNKRKQTVVEFQPLVKLPNAACVAPHVLYDEKPLVIQHKFIFNIIMTN